jgi:hypothetical protein
MKKLLVLVAVLALVAALVVPMAVSAGAPIVGDVNITGSVPSWPTTLTLNTPGTIDFSWFTVGLNSGNSSGSVVYAQGNDGVTGWGLTVKVDPGYLDPDDNVAHMAFPGTWLPSPIELSQGGAYYQFGAGNEFTYSGSTDGTTPLALYAHQNVNVTDKAGAYTMVVIYTLTPTP